MGMSIFKKHKDCAVADVNITSPWYASNFSLSFTVQSHVNINTLYPAIISSQARAMHPSAFSPSLF